MAGQRPHWIPAYIGIGSNLNDPPARVRQACAELDRLPESRLALCSPLYGNPPMGPQDQPDYVNAVAVLLTQLEPPELLRQLQGLEKRMGRVRTPGDKWGPRVIDLDLLMYAGRSYELDGLTLPHPGISERNFVVLPLCDIAPGLWIPGQGSVQSIAAKLDMRGLQRIEG